MDSWKEVATFFGRDERTVKRWEKERGLPIHRVPGGGRGTIFAYTGELTAWLSSPQVKESPDALIKIENAAVLPEERPSARPGTKRHWGTLGMITCGVFLLLIPFAFTHYYELHAVQGRLLPSVSVRTDSDAHRKAEELYLQGRYHWNKRTPEDLTIAVDDFSRSTQLDPNYALGYAGTADGYNLLREYTSTPGSQTFPLAIAAAKKSIELDPNLSEGHRALAFALFHWNWDIRGGEREFKRAIELNPNDVEAHHWYATALMCLARYPEAIAEIERARQLDPASSSVAADRAAILYASGRKEEGFAILKELEIADPKFYSPPGYLAHMYFEQKEYVEYFDQAELAAKLKQDDHALTAIAAARKNYKQGGEQALLHGELEEELQSYRQGRADAVTVATLYMALGKKQEALDYLEKAYERHDYGLIALAGFIAFRGMHDDPQFRDLEKRLYSPPVPAP